MRPIHSQRGFTLAEILTVVVILGIASAIVVPQIGSRDDLKVASLTRMAMADLIYAQNRAIATQQKHYVQFDAATQTYALFSDVPSSGNYVQHPLNKTDYVVRLTPSGGSGTFAGAIDQVSFDGKQILVFDDLGTPHSYDPSQPEALRLAPLTDGSVILKCGEQALTIKIEAYTGELSVPAWN